MTARRLDCHTSLLAGLVIREAAAHGFRRGEDDPGSHPDREDIQSRTTGPSVSQRLFTSPWTPSWVNSHCFLIRDPAKTLTSTHHQWNDFDELEVGFPEQRALFDLLTAINGAPPPVIDSDDLLEPEAIHGLSVSL